jgi:hypothetical protein
MIRLSKLAFSLVVIISIIGCENGENEADRSQTISIAQQKGLLGQNILIEGANFEQGKIRVLFDEQVSSVQVINPELVSARVPRTIERYNPQLKVIDLNDNTVLLNSNFALETPEILGYSTSEITFDEELIITGDYFDVDEDFIDVKINGVSAEILETSQESIVVNIPYSIEDSTLEVIVAAQLQETASTINLTLKAPELLAYEEADGVYLNLTPDFLVNGANFNPDPEHGEVIVDGIICDFTATPTQLQINLPFGPYQEFEINEVLYKTAGYTTTLVETIPILNDRIMVDYTEDNIRHSDFIHNGDTYKFFSSNMSSDNASESYTLKKFDLIEKKWVEPSNAYTYQGLLDDAVYDGSQYLYLYKRITTGPTTYALSKLDLDTLVEVDISMPFDNNVTTPVLFAYQDMLYFISGVRLFDGVPVQVTDRYSYNPNTQTWTTLPASMFSEIPSLPTWYSVSGKLSYLHYDQKLYITNGTIEGTLQINPDLSIVNHNYRHVLGYNGVLFGLATNTNHEDRIYNINTGQNQTIHNVSFARDFFISNNEIYFFANSISPNYPGALFSLRLRESLLDDFF